MSLKFNIDRPKVSDDEINKQKNFKDLVEKFKQQSLKKAQGDESWWKDKKIKYSTVILGITVICTVTYLSLQKFNQTQNKLNDKITTQNTKINSKAQSSNNAFVQAPSSKLKSKPTSYKVNNAQGAKIKHPSSSTINIPKNTFVDKNGKNIIGDVTIEYKEFHDLADVIAEGIPMAYDSAGKKYSLETAGMFDIRGYQNGEPVFIASDKNLEVELASTNSENRFNQYYLDTIKRNWQYLNHDKPLAIVGTSKNKFAESKTLELLDREIKVVIPRKIDSVGAVYKTRVVKLPVAKVPHKPATATSGRPNFKLDGSYEEFPELAAFSNVLFEVGPENKNYSKELHEITWSDVKITQGPIKGVNYLLNLSYRNRSEKLIVYPVFTGADYEKATASYAKQFENYTALVDKRNSEEKRLLEEMAAKQSVYLADQKKKQEEYDKKKADIARKYDLAAQNELASNFNVVSNQIKAKRLFMISQFGIFNSDCPHSLPAGKSVKPLFVSAENNKPIQPELIYLVDHSKKTVYILDKSNSYRMNYEPDQAYSICIFRNGKLFICNKNKFKESAETDSNKFFVQLMDEASSNPIEFKKALEI